MCLELMTEMGGFVEAPFERDCGDRLVGQGRVFEFRRDALQSLPPDEAHQRIAGIAENRMHLPNRKTDICSNPGAVEGRIRQISQDRGPYTAQCAGLGGEQIFVRRECGDHRHRQKVRQTPGEAMHDLVRVVPGHVKDLVNHAEAGTPHALVATQGCSGEGRSFRENFLPEAGVQVDRAGADFIRLDVEGL
mgnify:CR=1 FL=1